MFIKLVAMALAILCVVAENAAQNNQELTSVDLRKNNNYYEGVEVSIGTGYEKNTDYKAKFLIDISYPSVLVGDKDNGKKWGIICASADDNSCSIVNKEITDEYYFSKELKVNTAELHLRVDTNSKLDVKNPVIEKLPVKIAVAGDSWPVEDWGVLGLAPNSPFVKYLTNIYTKQASLAIVYKTEDITKKKMDFRQRVFLNPVVNATYVVGELNYAAEDKYWSVTGDHEFIEPAFSFKNAKICINNVDDEIIQVIDVMDRCNILRKKLCKGKGSTGMDCKKEDVNLQDAPPLTFKVGELTFNFQPEEYIYFDEKNYIQCRFGDVETIRNNESCGRDTEFGFGRLFLQKYIPIFHYNTDGTSKITLLSKYEMPVDPKPIPDPTKKKSKLIWIIIGVTAAIIAAIVLVAVVMKNKNNTNDEYYRDFNTRTT